MSEKITAMIEEIKGLSVLELAELVHALEDTFGVSAAAGLARAVLHAEEGRHDPRGGARGAGVAVRAEGCR